LPPPKERELSIAERESSGADRKKPGPLQQKELEEKSKRRNVASKEYLGTNPRGNGKHV
jgi:hypothetical protein